MAPIQMQTVRKAALSGCLGIQNYHQQKHQTFWTATPPPTPPLPQYLPSDSQQTPLPRKEATGSGHHTSKNPIMPPCVALLARSLFSSLSKSINKKPIVGWLFLQPTHFSRIRRTQGENLKKRKIYLKIFKPSSSNHSAFSALIKFTQCGHLCS